MPRVGRFLLDDHEAEYETARADLLCWHKQGLLQTREDVEEGIETAPRAFIRMLRAEKLEKRLIKLCCARRTRVAYVPLELTAATRQ